MQSFQRLRLLQNGRILAKTVDTNCGRLIIKDMKVWDHSLHLNINKTADSNGNFNSIRYFSSVSSSESKFTTTSGLENNTKEINENEFQKVSNDIENKASGDENLSRLNRRRKKLLNETSNSLGAKFQDEFSNENEDISLNDESTAEINKNKHDISQLLEENNFNQSNSKYKKKSRNNSESKQRASSKFSSKVEQSKIKQHPYNNIYKWQNVTQLAEKLMESRIYEDKHIIALNKPFGVGQTVQKSLQYNNFYGSQQKVKLTLEDALPALKSMTGCEKLEVCMSPERWNSGVLILSKKGKAKNLVNRTHDFARQHRITARCYWAITQFAPSPRNKQATLAAVRLETSKTGAKVPVISIKPTSSQITNHRVSPFYAQHSTLSKADDSDSALVEVYLCGRRHNCLRVWLSHFLAVPIGDKLFGGRVATLMGKPVPVPYSRASTKQTYTYEFLEKLELKPSTQDLIPLFIHMRRLLLPHYHAILKPSKTILTGINDQERRIPKEDAEPVLDETGRDIKDDLILTAPLPEHFQWTLDKLGLTPEDIMDD